MSYITTKDQISHYRDLYDGVWESARLCISTIEANGVRVPNGELIFSKDPIEPGEEILYEEGPLTIHEIIVESPFDLLNDLAEGHVPTADEEVTIDAGIKKHNPGGYFRGHGIDEGRTREDRPYNELNASIDIDLSDETEEEYTSTAEDLEDQLRRADEPYFDVGRCEGYYFEHIFRSPRDDPKILVFANPEITHGIDEETLEIVTPPELTNKISISVLPQHPYDEHKGWRIEPSNSEFEGIQEGLVKYTEEMELEDIEKLYAVLYLDEEMLDMYEHYSDTDYDNQRYTIIDAYDQANKLERYLTGHDPDRFEEAVLNALSTAGWIVQWFGDDNFDVPSFSPDVPGAPYSEIDLIAYHPDGSEILFVECTNSRISEKEQILDRVEAITSVIEDRSFRTEGPFVNIQEFKPCIATPQSPEELNEQVVDELEGKGIIILNGERLKSIYTASQENSGTFDIETRFFEGV